MRSQRVEHDLATRKKKRHSYNTYLLPDTKWQPTPVFLPGKSHGQRRLVGYSPWGCKESDMTKQLTHTHRASKRKIIQSS